MRPLISIQLYTVRDQLKQDEPGTLEKISAIGYEGVEIGYGASEAFLNKCAELSLEITGFHADLKTLQNDFDGVVEFARRIGNEFVILPWLDEQYRRDASGWTQSAQMLSDIGARLREKELRFLYHNHDFEFQRFDGEYGLDILYKAPEENLGAELDTYWIAKGGADPVEYINSYASRTPILHIKDMTQGGDFAEVGQGTLDWPAIFAAAEKAGVSVYAVEQDQCPGDPFDSIRISLENLRKMGKI